MEVELDVEEPQENWRLVVADWDEPFSPADWERHAGWWRHCPEPRICLRVFRMLSIIEAWSLFVSLVVALYATYLQPKPGWPVAVSGDYMIVFQLTSFAVALLLVFRTNTAHSRWWEARQAFGRWLNCVRNAQRMLLSWADPSEAPVVHEFARWNAALATSACAYLRRKDCYWQHMEGLLQPAELAWLMRCDNAPVKVLMIMSGLLKRTGLLVWERAEIERQLSDFDIALGALERISRQAVPKAYTRHTSRFIICYITFLPFALWSYLEWLLLPTMVVLTFLLLGIENIGIQIENPVRVLPLHSFCLGMKTAALSMVRHQPDVQRAIDTGLVAASARHQHRLLQKLSGEPASPLAEQPAQQQQQQQQLQPNGHHAAGGQPAAVAPATAGVQPMPGMSR
ncbi:hypothetical protein CHLNCDRAFT_137443 [Chlorella variabilis]|uniref:Uncharacterized protein n=1 Tax=Chlorella variabilis TaxID=554065 RepID=E1ZMG2_CHLVA|nr:hypothetical protein CHLNCDRAFT_137443 [Chlorella variabilis]EFN52998.1 hypothetical protein CHLNCDRAFT_137443 [Chlorella variabilis]|eukprot:XP_005845100.1 hypothetical protein CHLNCDRAFT_137443 [Chlorella variabilis]